MGDAAEILIVKERVVKQPVVMMEALRVRKTPRTGRRIVEADVRKEDIAVEESGVFV